MQFLQAFLEKLNKLFFQTNYRGKLQLDCLDGIRGLAVLFVLVGHISTRDITLASNFKIAGSGKTGVYIFFVLSAFLLTRNLIKKSDRDIANWRTWLDYFSRRLLRIYPLYILVMLSTMILNTLNRDVFRKSLSLTDFWHHLLLLDGKGHFWTIMVEVRYYFVMPLLVFAYCFLLKRKDLQAGILLLATVILAELFSYMSGISDKHLFTHFYPIFAAGSGLAIIQERFEKRAEQEESARSVWFGWAAWLCLASLIFLIPSIFNSVMQAVTGVAFEYSFREPIFAVFWGILCAALIFFTLNSSGLLNRILSHKSMRFVGLISYSIYLWHISVLDFINAQDINSLAKLCAFYLGIAIVGSISFLVIERPLSRIRINPLALEKLFGK